MVTAGFWLALAAGPALTAGAGTTVLVTVWLVLVGLVPGALAFVVVVVVVVDEADTGAVGRPEAGTGTAKGTKGLMMLLELLMLCLLVRSVCCRRRSLSLF